MKSMQKTLLSLLGVLFISLFLVYGQTSANEITTNANPEGTTFSLNAEEITSSENVNEITAESDFGLNAIDGPKYPGTNTPMRAGDVLYSSKTLGSSSQIVGHVGIVGSDYRVYHVTPAKTVNGGVADGVYKYMDRHGPAETITIYRHRLGYGVAAAAWAENNYSRVTDYFINPFSLLSTISPNYCSKFLWQAFYYGDGIDIMDMNKKDYNMATVLPDQFTNSTIFARIGSFSTN